ncbi:MAG: amidohydrolase family protein, partial [Clostridia bacterium]|nr:amidohydrolase family protein [Clostridia bacterium]
TPARIVGIENKGAIKQGFDADIIIFDDNINIERNIVGGKTVYINENKQ